jgi:hypothetical protein
MELDADIGRIMATIRAQAPNTIVIVTADNGAWLDAYPDTGTIPYRGEKGSAFEGGWRVPGIMWWPNNIPAGVRIDVWATLAAMVGLTPPPHDWVGNDGKPIYFGSIDNSAYILGKARGSKVRTRLAPGGIGYAGLQGRARPKEVQVRTWLSAGAKRIRTLGPTRVRRPRQPQGSLLTPRWREMDSNPRSPVSGAVTFWAVYVPVVIGQRPDLWFARKNELEFARPLRARRLG